MPQPPLPREAFAAEAQQGLATSLFRVFGAAPPSQQYALAKALNDSGKLKALDGLLHRLKAEGHRCLIFCQVSWV
jgi:SNF2 family DNA or RNA helicase